jgi:5-methyltetrahydrofolate--homocysteine methyltransferase
MSGRSRDFSGRRIGGRIVGIMSNLLQRLLAAKDVVIADGAMGTSLFALGLGKGESGADWNVERPDAVRSVHQGFVDAGSDIILTNTFSANRIRLALHRLEHRAREFNLAGARIAREVADRAGRPIVVAGDIGPIGDVLEPLGSRSVEEAEDAFYEQAQALKEGGADIAWIETMFADNEPDAAIRAVQRAGLDYVATMTFDSAGRTMMGVRPEDAMRRSREFPVKPIAFGANCGVGPAQLMDSVLGLVQGAERETIVVAKSNCGIPVLDDDMRVHYNGTPEVLGEYAVMARDAGARIIGGCCGTTPEHIRSIVAALAKHPKGPPPTYAEIEKKLGPLTATTGADEAPEWSSP